MSLHINCLIRNDYLVSGYIIKISNIKHILIKIKMQIT